MCHFRFFLKHATRLPCFVVKFLLSALLRALVPLLRLFPSHPQALKSPCAMTLSDVHIVHKTQHFVKLLDTDAVLDLAKLRLEASSGVPARFRRAVWALLLGVTGPASSSIRALSPANPQIRFAALSDAFDDNGRVAQGIRSELRRACASIPNSKAPKTIERFLTVIGAYVASTSGTLEASLTADDEAIRDMVHIAAFVLPVFEDSDEDAFAAFQAIMHRCKPFYRREGLDRAMGDFLMLFKAMLQDLHEVFVDRDFNMNQWAPSALRSLLLRQLPRDCGYRLLDTYIARTEENWKAFHLHVCLATLAIMHERDEFNDIESESVLHRLNQLPATLPIEVILNRATTFQQESVAAGYVPSTPR